MDEDAGQNLFQDIRTENVAPEEEEDIEEQRRRQAEISNYLKNAMGSFMSDEQSMVNTSVNTLAEEVNRSQIDEYNDLNLDEQLKVLYEVRVRECQSLKSELEELKRQFSIEKESSCRQYMICEGEKIKAQMSLQECQGLLSEKTDELNQLHKKIEEATKLIAEQHEEISKLQDENASNTCVINELHKQIKCLEQDLPLKCQISSDQVIESRNREISKLQQLLETANNKIEILEGKIQSMEQDLKKAYTDKENVIVEKNDVIFRLTYSIEDAQKQCKELLQNVEALNKDNARLRENLHQAETESKRNLHAVDIAQVKILNETINKDKKLLEEKEAEINNLKKLISKFHQDRDDHHFSNRSVQVNTEESLMEQFNQALKEKNNVQIQLEMCNIQLQELKEKNAALQTEIFSANEKILEKNTKIDGLSKKIADTERQLKQTLQNGEIDNYKIIQGDLQKQLDVAQTKLVKANEEIASLKKQLVFKENREKLIEDLQNQAAKFEEIIMKQQKVLVTTSTNTEGEPCDKNESSNNDLLKETQQKYSALINTQKEDIRRLQNKLLEDRHVMATVFEKWSEKVRHIEQQLHVRDAQLKIVEAELEKSKTNEEKLQKNVHNLQKEVQSNLKRFDDYKIASIKILKTGQTATSILEKLTKADDEVQKIEQRFRKHRKHLTKDIHL